MNWFLSLIPCMSPAAVRWAAVFCIALLVQLLVPWKFPGRRYRWFLFVQVLVLVLILWLGSYRFSPVYARARILHGFDITVRDRAKTHIQSGEIVTLGHNSMAFIVPITLPGDSSSCNWSSQNGGALDEPGTCETIYAPPSADYDILRLSIRSSCGLANGSGQIKFSILP